MTVYPEIDYGNVLMLPGRNRDLPSREVPGGAGDDRPVETLVEKKLRTSVEYVRDQKSHEVDLFGFTHEIFGQFG